MHWLARSGWIFLGAGIGANLRYWLGLAISSRLGHLFPWHTLTVNVTGSVCIGVFFAVASRDWSPTWQLFLAVGLLGGYTTFSSFAYETLKLLTETEYALAAANFLLSNMLSVGGCALGMVLARVLR